MSPCFDTNIEWQAEIVVVLQPDTTNKPGRTIPLRYRTPLTGRQKRKLSATRTALESASMTSRWQGLLYRYGQRHYPVLCVYGFGAELVREGGAKNVCGCGKAPSFLETDGEAWLRS